MTTSFNMTRDQLVTAGLRKIAVLGDGQSPSATQLANGTQALNVMLKTFQTKGMPLWAIVEYDLPLLTATQSYALSIAAPLKVIQGLRIDADGNLIEIIQKTHTDFNRLNPTTTTTGTPVAFRYESGVVQVWPVPDTDDYQLRLVYQRPSNDMVVGTDVLDFPQYWMEAVIYGLAHRLSPEYGIPLQDRQTIAKEAEYFLQEALSFGTEEGSLFLQPDWTSR